MHDTEPLDPQETAHEQPHRGEHPTKEKEQLQHNAPHDDRVRERGPNTGGGKLRPSDR